MKKINLIIVSAFLLASGIIVSCKKATTDPTTTSTASKPNDQQGSSEADGAISDVTDFINNGRGGGSTHRVSAYSLPCGVVSIDSTLSGSHYIYSLHYGNQTTCGYGGYKKKSGTVSFALSNGTAFNTAGSVHTITFTDYVVENTYTSQSVKLNGTITITNVNGGYVWEPIVTSSTVVTHKIRGTFSITYTDGTVRNRSYYQLRTYSSTGGWAGLSLKIDGDSTTTAGLKLSEVGKTYEKNIDYQTQIINPLIWANTGTTYAGPYVLEQGKARQNYTIAGISPTYIEVEAGYNYNVTSLTGTLVNNNTSNAYKVTTVIGTSSTSAYQLY